MIKIEFNIKSIYITILFVLSIIKIHCQQFIINDEIPANSLIADLSTSPAFATHYISGKAEFRLLSISRFVSLLFIRPKTGQLYSRRKIDRDALCKDWETCCSNTKSCSVPISVAMKLPKSSSSPSSEPLIQQFKLLIIDKNDNPPKFIPNTVNITISEAAQPSEVFMLPSAQDDDSEVYSVKNYRLKYSALPSISSSSINGQYIENIFGVETNFVSGKKLTCSLRLKQQLDREKQEFYTLTVLAIDGGSPARTGTLTVNVIVDDVNDNPPRFEKEQYRVDVKEGPSTNTPILTVHATDKDIGDNGRVIYQMDSSLSSAKSTDMFRINPATGDILVIGLLDYEQEIEYKLIITASNYNSNDLKSSNTQSNKYSSTRLITTATVLVTVININDEKPTIFADYLNENKRGFVKENDGPNKFIAYFTVKDKDKNSAGYVECKLENSANRKFELKTVMEGHYTLVTREKLDREVQSEYSFLLECVDNGSPPLTTDTQVLITVTDENDNSPIIKSPSTIKILENQPINTVVTKIIANDSDSGENSRLIYQISNPTSSSIDSTNLHDYSNNHDILDYIQINKDSGVISTVKLIDRESTIPPLESIDFLLTVKDCGKESKSAIQMMKLIIEDENDNPPKFAKNIFRFDVNENDRVGQRLGQIEVSDADLIPSSLQYPASGDNNYQSTQQSDLRLTISYKKKHYTTSPFDLVAETDSGTNSMSSLTPIKRYWIKTTQSLDWEKQSEHELIVIATDSGYNNNRYYGNNNNRYYSNKRHRKSHTSSATIIIKVNDMNDNKPVFIFPKPQSINNTTSAIVHRLSYRQAPGFILLTVRAHDKDNPETPNGKFFFSIQGGSGQRLLNIDSSLGQIRTQQHMVAEDIGEYFVIVQVQDNGNPVLSSELSIRFRVVDSEAQYNADSNNNVGIDNHINSGSSYNGRREPIFPINKEGILILGLVVFLVIFMLLICLIAYLRHIKGWFPCLPDVLGSLCGGPNSIDGNNSTNHRDLSTNKHDDRARKQQQQQRIVAAMGSQTGPGKFGDDRMQNFYDSQQPAYRHLMNPAATNYPEEDEVLLKTNRDYYEILRLESEMAAARNCAPMYPPNSQQQPYMCPPVSIIDSSSHFTPQHQHHMRPTQSFDRLHDSYLSLNQYPTPVPLLPSSNKQHNNKSATLAATGATCMKTPELIHKQASSTASVVVNSNNNDSKKTSYAVSYPTDQSTFV